MKKKPQDQPHSRHQGWECHAHSCSKFLGISPIGAGHHTDTSLGIHNSLRMLAASSAQGGAQHPSTSIIGGLCCLRVSAAGSKLGQTGDQPEFFLLPKLGPSPAELHAEGQLAVRRAGDPLRLAAVSPDPAGDVHLGQAWKKLGTHTDM